LIDRLLPGYVDAYVGPPEARESAAAVEPAIDLLEGLAASLDRSLAADPWLTPDRRSYLREELRAMRTTIRILAGDPPGIVEEVELLYGVTPRWVDEKVFVEAHHALDGSLPGSGPLRERVMGFRERSRVTAGVAGPIIRGLAAELRGRASAVFGLPPDEGCEIAFVRDKPWLAFNWYLGGGRSRIEFNEDVPIEMWNLPIAVAHETYPGHHAERAIKDYQLYLGEGRLEHSIFLSNTPSALVSEGIAENALQAVAAEEETEEMTVRAYRHAGLPQNDAQRVREFIDAYRRLDKVTDNQVLLLYRDHAPDDEVIAYGTRYGLTDEEDGKRLLRFCRDPLSRSYTYNYTLGRELVGAFLAETNGRTERFRRLLHEPLTPTQLLRASASAT
jgi:hypothetical protein